MRKSALFFITLISLISQSCHKESQNIPKITVPVGSIMANIDGVGTFFNNNAHATLDTIPWAFNTEALILSIKGNRNIDSNSENILIWFFVNPVKRIDAGTYPDLTKQIYQYVELNNLWKGDLYNYGSNRFVDNFYSSVSTIVKIDSIVQGVFNGNVGIGTGAVGIAQPPLYHKITCGQFNVRLTN